MANNYTQFSFTVDVPADQAAWLAAVHEHCNNPPDDDADLAALEIGYPTAFGGISQCSTGDLCPSVDVSQDGASVWFHADDCGDVEYTADLMGAMLEAFNSDAIVSFTWANTCSAMRVDEFDGGAVVITKEGADYLSPVRWIDAKIAEITAARATVAT